MRWLVPALLVFTLAALGGWPYLYLYRLDRAVQSGDRAAMERLVDLPAVRDTIKARLAARVSQTMGTRPDSRRNSILGWIEQGVRQIGERAIDITIDLDWVLDTLRSHRPEGGEAAPPASLLGATSYAFFESWDRFLVRIERGEKPPLQVWMELREGRWRVTGILD